MTIFAGISLLVDPENFFQRKSDGDMFLFKSTEIRTVTRKSLDSVSPHSIKGASNSMISEDVTTCAFLQNRSRKYQRALG